MSAKGDKMMKTNEMRRWGLVAAAMLLPALAGCSQSTPEEQPVAAAAENELTVTDGAADENMTAVANMDEVAAPATNAAEEIPPPPPERTVDQQMLDDASATGMTSRVQRDAPAADAPATERKGGE